MNINQTILSKVKSYGARLILVTKYLDSEQTKIVCNQIEQYEVVWGLGERRVADLEKKNIPREKAHFIGNIQSRDIEQIMKYCSVVHSLCTIRHAKKFEELLKTGLFKEFKFFIQVNISEEDQKSGIMPGDLEDFLSELRKECPILITRLLGLSALGKAEFTIPEKQAEFQALKELRKGYFADGILSAGTSRDYMIGLEEGIHVVRIGKAFWE